MRKASRRTVAAVAVGIAAVVGGGGAIAATKLTTPQAESKAVVADAAKRLGVDPAKLTDALAQASAARVDAAVADGRLTKEQGEAIKARIAAGDVPLVGAPGFGVRGHHGEGRGHFGRAFGGAAAADYLGLSESALREQLASGTSLADVAKAQGKSVDGLEKALVAEAKAQLDAAVKSGRITQAQADSMLSEVESRVAQEVTETHVPGDRGDCPDGPGGGPGDDSGDGSSTDPSTTPEQAPAATPSLSYAA